MILRRQFMHGAQEGARMFRVDFRRDAVTQVEHVTTAFAIAGENAADFCADGFRFCVQHGRVHVALQRDLVTDTGAGTADVAGPVQAQCVGTSIGDAFQPQAAVLGEQDHRHLATFMLADQTADDFLHVGQGELLVRRSGEAAAPAVEDLHRLRAGHDLAVEVAGNGLRELVQQQVQGLRVVVEHGFGLAVVFRRAAFDHVGRQGPWAASKADQRHTAIQLAADGADRVHHVAQVFLRIRNRQGFDVGQGADDFPEARTFTGFEVQALAHGIGDGQDVGKEDRRIQLWIAVERLHRDFASERRVHAQAHEIAGLGTAGAVFRQVATGLTHHPHWGDVYGLLEQGAQETVVLQGSHVGIRKKSEGIFSEPEAKGTVAGQPFVYRVNLSQ
ncbi:NAD-specific glutamate dehydrogenase [Pseudomonas sp. IT-P74]